MDAVAPVDWPTVAFWVVVPFALFAVGLEQYRRFESGHLRYARTVSFGAAAIVAIVALVLALWSPTETIKAVGLLGTFGALLLGVRFCWLADRDEHHRAQGDQQTQSIAFFERRADWAGRAKAVQHKLNDLVGECRIRPLLYQYHPLSSPSEEARDLETHQTKTVLAARDLDPEIATILDAFSVYGVSMSDEEKLVLTAYAPTIDALDDKLTAFNRVVERF